MTDSTRSGEETGRAAPYEGTQPSGTTDSRSSSPDNSAAKGRSAWPDVLAVLAFPVCLLVVVVAFLWSWGLL